jgi:hypothetical protein
MNKNGLDIHSAAHAILGISLDELGVCVARHWKFPENIIYGMRSLPEGVVDKPNSTLEMLRHFSIFANELCELASNTFSEQREYLLSQLVQRLILSRVNLFKVFSDLLMISMELNRPILMKIRFTTSPNPLRLRISPSTMVIRELKANMVMMKSKVCTQRSLLRFM